MKFDYLRLAIGLVQALVRFLTYLRERELLQAGEARAVARYLRQAAEDVSRANKARDETRRRNDSIPDDRSLPADEFTRGS